MEHKLSPDVHSDTLGGSSAERRYHCAASYNLEEGMPSLPGSAAATRGTALHEAAARCVKAGTSVTDAAEMIGWECEQTGYTLLHSDVTDYLQPALEAFYVLLDEQDVDNVVLERMIDFNTASDFGVPDAIGTADVIGVSADKTRVLVVDWKFGHHPVSAEFNLQLAFYAYGALFLAVNWETFESCEGITVAIIQPSGREPCIPSVYDFTALELIEIAKVWEKNYVERKDTEPVKGKWCHWCKAKPICSAHVPDSPTFSGLLTAGRDYSIGATTPVVVPVTQEPQSPVEYLAALPFDPLVSNEKLGVMLDDWQKILAWVSDRTGYLERLLFGKAEDGEDTPGYKLVEKRNQRTWDDPGKAEAVLKRRLGAANALPRTLISPPQAEKQLGPAVYKKTVAKYVSTRSAGIKLVPEDDSRDSVNVTERFQEVGQMLQDLKEGAE